MPAVNREGSNINVKVGSVADGGVYIQWIEVVSGDKATEVSPAAPMISQSIVMSKNILHPWIIS